MKTFRILLLSTALTLCMTACSRFCICSVDASEEDLHFEHLAQSWDEGIPLGNAVIGNLIWQNDSTLRFSLDRTDLWDLRPTDSLAGENFRFSWVKEHIRNGNYRPVQQKLDNPYNEEPAPSKIPGAALEFPLHKLGEVQDVHLYLNDALCEIKWKDGAIMQTFVQADRPVGWFVFKNVGKEFSPTLVAPDYEGIHREGTSLSRLGYRQGAVLRNEHSIYYHQKGYGDYYYDVAVSWKHRGGDLYGVWSVTSSLSGEQADTEVSEALNRGMRDDYAAHLNYWRSFWDHSSISLPDSVLQRQYRNEMYKYASATREYSSPISLQAVWTADNGQLPPWKGDYHHDLNTQMSYWPSYIGNHLDEGLGYLNTLWNQRETYRRYTRQYFETDGMNVPGVATLSGEPMGGWIQYAMSQTTGAWLAQHFYLHWKYSADREFLKERAYPFIKEVAVCLEQLSFVDDQGIRRLEFSSSPEIFDNSLQAWFQDMTNYDLALLKFIFRAAGELAGELELIQEEDHWKALDRELPKFYLDQEGALTFAKGFPYQESHRHFSHALAIHPLGLIDWADGEEARQIILATLKKLEDYGVSAWCGYSYSWLANLYARAFEGEKAVEALRVFADCFCLPNTFHANGDQSGTGKSGFTYRPFTLEGNFAFAAALQEMLLQSHSGIVQVFPAIPAYWKNVSFENLRAMGAFLISAELSAGKVSRLSVFSEKGGNLSIMNPLNGKIEHYQMEAGEHMNLIMK